MTARLALITILVLSACGASGPPESRSEKPAPEPGVFVSGTAEIGITGGGF